MNRKRYFQEISDRDKYSVGQLSPRLRDALNLEDDMLPFWIYRMRVLGYPPAWMKEAEMSTLNVIDLPGSSKKRDKNPFALQSEKGEVKDTAQYNKDSFIEYPGFNAPLPENVKDDWLILGMPPLIMKQQLTEAVKSMKLIEPVPYKKAKLDQAVESNDDEDSTSEDGEINESAAKSMENESTNEETSINASTIQSSQTDSQNESVSSERKIKIVSMGPPVPESIKPKLPPLEKWGIGMGELIYFENLPTSTGAYKGKMKGILEKVRDRHSKNE